MKRIGVCVFIILLLAVCQSGKTSREGMAFHDTSVITADGKTLAAYKADYSFNQNNLVYYDFGTGKNLLNNSNPSITIPDEEKCKGFILLH